MCFCPVSPSYSHKREGEITLGCLCKKKVSGFKLVAEFKKTLPIGSCAFLPSSLETLAEDKTLFFSS